MPKKKQAAAQQTLNVKIDKDLWARLEAEVSRRKIAGDVTASKRQIREDLIREGVKP